MDTYLPPNRFLAIRSIASPKDTNVSGDIAAGWLVAQMDLAGNSTACSRSHGRVTTVSIETLSFHQPVYVGDEISIYTEVQRMGKTSMHIKIDVWAKRNDSEDSVQVTEGILVYVAIDKDYSPRQIHH